MPVIPPGRAAAVLCLWLAACGPEVAEDVDVQPWMSGVWSSAFLDEYSLQFTDADNADPGHFTFDSDGVFRGPLSNEGPELREWEPISETEVRVHANKEEAQGSFRQILFYTLTLTAGVRDCDTIEVEWTYEDQGEVHTSHTVDLYRGAICLFPNPPCDDEDAEQVEPQCGGMHFDWCDPPFPTCGMDCFCHLDSPGTVALTPSGQ